MCKRGEGSLSVALINSFYDSVLDPVVKLDKAYSSVRFLGCEGELCGNEVRLSAPIGAFSQAFFEVTL